MSQSYNAALVNKIIADFQKGEKRSSFNKLRKFVNDYPKDTTARYNFALICEELKYIDLENNICDNLPDMKNQKKFLQPIYVSDNKLFD